MTKPCLCRNHIRLVALFSLLLAFFGAGHIFAADAPSSPAPVEQTPAQEAPLAQIWAARANDLAVLADDAALLEKEANDKAPPLAALMGTVQPESRRLLSLFQASRGHPTEQLTLLLQLRALKGWLDKLIEPLDVISSAIHQRLDEVDKLRQDMASLDKGEESAEQVEFTKALTATRRQLNTSAGRVDKIITPAKAAQDRLAATVQNLQANIQDIWQDFYFTPSSTGLDSYTPTWDLLKNWGASLHTRMSFANPQNSNAWLGAGQKFLANALVLGAIGWLLYLGARRLPLRWQKSCTGIVKSSWVWVTLGASLLGAARNDQGGVYFALVILGVLGIVWGISDLTGRLRGTAIPAIADRPQPLLLMYIAAGLGVFMLFSDLPGRFLSILWAVGMIAFIAAMHRFRRAYWTGEPKLESICTALSLLFAAVSLLMGLAGYARLAILVFMLLFAAVNTIILAFALTALAHIMSNRLLDPKTLPVRHAILDAISVPIAWTLSLACTLPWIWAVPGSTYIIQFFLGTHYNIGEASFDFSKVALIIVIFFLFRSFVRLGNTSLTHLPDRIPNIERGVIPPLKTLLSYGLWVLFAIIVLSLLGVSLTSLAVVAGGLSVGIGFGLQNLFNNLVSGIMIIFGRSLLVGDYIEVGAMAGTVREVNIRSTVIETPDRALVSIPNSSLMTGPFINWTRNTRRVRRAIAVGAAYGSDVNKVMGLLRKAAEEHQNVLKLPAPLVIFNNFGASSLDFTLYVTVDDFDNATQTTSDLRVEIERSFKENGIEMPFP